MLFFLVEIANTNSRWWLYLAEIFGRWVGFNAESEGLID
jgi:hypothetical protein